MLDFFKFETEKLCIFLDQILGIQQIFWRLSWPKIYELSKEKSGFLKEHNENLLNEIGGFLK